MAYLLDQAIELAGPKTLSGKALLKTKQALHRGDDKTAGKYLYQAFDNLPKKHTDTPLTPKEKQLIEDQLAKLFQKNVTINCKLVDKLANKSYVHLQTGGSIVSYRYLLEALDLARLPIPKSLQKMAQVGSPKLLSSKLQSTKLQSRCGQVGGSVPLIVGGVSAGLAIIGLIIYLIRRRNQTTSPLEGSLAENRSEWTQKHAAQLAEKGLSNEAFAARNNKELAALAALADLPGEVEPVEEAIKDDIRQGVIKAISLSLAQDAQMKKEEAEWRKTHQVPPQSQGVGFIPSPNARPTTPYGVMPSRSPIKPWTSPPGQSEKVPQGQ